MIEEHHGTTGSVAERRFAIIVSKYHISITGRLLEGAIGALKRNRVPPTQIVVLWVPGAWEIPLAVQAALETETYDAILTLGCVIRGETTHDLHINTTVSNGLGQLSLDYNKPVAFGLLTCNTMDQAIQRAGGDVGNKGVDVAEAAIHMLLLRHEISSNHPDIVSFSEPQSLPFMSRRSRAREIVLQVLYQDDLNPEQPEEIRQRFIHARLAHNVDMVAFAEKLLVGVRKKIQEVDQRLEETASNWKLTRMAVTDRNVLRLGAYEILFTDTPERVAINEAINLAKRYGTKNSSQFVNGILDRLMKNQPSR